MAFLIYVIMLVWNKSVSEILLISYFYRSEIEQVKVSCKGSNLWYYSVHVRAVASHLVLLNYLYIIMISQVIIISTGKTKTIVYT